MDKQDTIDLICYYLFVIMITMHIIFFKDILPWVCLAWLLVMLLPAVLSCNSKIRYQACFLSYTTVASLTSLVCSLLFLLRPRDPRNIRFFTYSERLLSKIFGINYEIRGIHKLINTQKAIIVVNHQSILDVFGLSRIWNAVGRGTIIAKRQLILYWPVGMAAWLAGIILITKNQGPTARKQFMQQSRDHLMWNQDKSSIVIFPEGKRSNCYSQLQTFKKGAFWLAHDLKVPVIPVVFSPFTFVKSFDFFRRGKIVVTILDPVETKDVETDKIDSMVQETWENMNQTFVSFYNCDK